MFFPDVPPVEAAPTLADMRATTDLPRKLYPLLVTFDDINDPASVKRVDPNDLAASFDAGYALKSITIAITDEPVTEGQVETVLGWLGKLSDYRTVPNNPFTNTLPSEIGYLRSN